MFTALSWTWIQRTQIKVPLRFQNQTEDVWTLLWGRALETRSICSEVALEGQGKHLIVCSFIRWLIYVTVYSFCLPALCQPQWGKQRRMRWLGPLGTSMGPSMGTVMRSPCLWAVLFTLTPWPQHDASPLRASCEVHRVRRTKPKWLRGRPETGRAPGPRSPSVLVRAVLHTHYNPLGLESDQQQGWHS